MRTRAERCGALNRLEAAIEDAVGLGQQAGGLGRGLEAQEEVRGQEKPERSHDEKRSAGAPAHEGPSGIPYHSKVRAMGIRTARLSVTTAPEPVPVRHSCEPYCR